MNQCGSTSPLLVYLPFTGLPGREMNIFSEFSEPSSGVTDSWAQGIVPVVVTNEEVGNESQIAVQEDASHELYDGMKENETNNNQNELAER